MAEMHVKDSLSVWHKANASYIVVVILLLPGTLSLLIQPCFIQLPHH